MARLTRQHVLLIAQVLLLVVVAGRHLPPLVRTSDNEWQGRREVHEAVVDSVVPVRIGYLDRTANTHAIKRNLFEFEKAEIEIVEVPEEPHGGNESQQSSKSKEIIDEPPRIDVEFLGIFGSETRRIAVFKDEPDVIINALENDVIKDQFIVHEIGGNSVEIAFVGWPDAAPQHVRIGSK